MNACEQANLVDHFATFPKQIVEKKRLHWRRAIKTRFQYREFLCTRKNSPLKRKDSEREEIERTKRERTRSK